MLHCLLKKKMLIKKIKIKTQLERRLVKVHQPMYNAPDYQELLKRIQEGI